MKKYILQSLVIILCALLFAGPVFAGDLRGLILINVESHGEAWYLNPGDSSRYYLGRPADALEVVKKLALGIKKSDLVKIQYNVPTKLLGKFLLVVDDSGKAYYVNPKNKDVLYLGAPASMFRVMQQTGIGITNKDISKISIAKNSASSTKIINLVSSTSEYSVMEKKIQDLVNLEREGNGLKTLKWNDELAIVARRHSQDQAKENEKLVRRNKLCSFPFIHHEGVEIGLYHADRLNYYKIYYQSASAENIALIPESRESSYRANGIEPRDCQAEVNILNKNYEEEIKKLTKNEDKIAYVNKEIILRENLTNNSQDIQIIENYNSTFEQIEKQAVKGWMNSPGHRKNILNNEYDEAGIGVAYINGYFIITQVFIKRALCGYKGGVCCQVEGFYPFCFVPWSCALNMCQ